MYYYSVPPLCLPAHLSHVVGDVEIHVHTDYELHQVLRETDILVYDGEMKRSAEDRKNGFETTLLQLFEEVAHTK